MIGYLFKKVFGTKNDREVKKLRGLVKKINDLEESFQSLSEEALREKTLQWKATISAIEDDEQRAQAPRTQQIIAEEAGVTNTVDPLAGSYYVEKLTDMIEDQAMEYI